MTNKATAPSPGNGRPPLTRQFILEEALTIVDEQGLAALTMRELSARLGYTDMALYKYVTNRDDVLDGVVDLLLSRITVPDGDDGAWEARLYLLFTSLFALHRQHPRALSALLARPLSLPSVIGGAKNATAMLVAAGFDESEASAVLATLSAYTLGYAALHCGGFFAHERPLAPARTRSRRRQTNDCPGLLGNPDWERVGEGFELGLAAVLSGLRLAHERPAL